MLVFTRRAIQECLDELSGVLTARQISDLAARLNLVGAGRLAATWEACLLRGFNRAGNLSHEVALDNGRKPDITFSYRGEQEIAFVADITVISDEGLNDANPIHEFRNELVALSQSYGLNPNHLYFNVRAKQAGRFRFRKITLLLPSKSQIKEFIVLHASPFFRKICEQKLKKHSQNIEIEGVSFTISFDESQQFMGGTHPSYNIPQSIKNNPLWNRLVDKAKRQLSTAANLAPVGIIVCDGGCALLNVKWPSPDAFKAEDVIWQFLKEFPLFSFVSVLRVETSTTMTFERCHTLDLNTYARVTDSRTQRIHDLLSEVVSLLPRPADDPLNAYYRSRESHCDVGHHGGCKMSGGSVTISLRLLHELLAGRRSPGQFNQLHQWRAVTDAGTMQESPFDRALASGRMIKKVRVEPDQNADDDWVTFEFGDPDPAISPFAVPRRQVRE